VDQVNYTTQKAWKAHHFVMRVLKKGNGIRKFSLHVSGMSCSGIWVCMLGPMQRRTDKCVTSSREESCLIYKSYEGFDWETLVQRRTIARLCVRFKAYSGERAGKTTYDRLRRPYYLSTVDHVRKIRDRKQRTVIGKYFFVNGTFKTWNQLPAEALGTFPCKPKNFRKRYRKAFINEVKQKE